jgi:thioredoxin-related protein
MPVNWGKNDDLALAEAKTSNRPVLIDFTAAPACAGCVRLDAESYMNDELSTYIHRHFIPLRMCNKENIAQFDHFEVLWTPTVLILDSGAKERYRIEGYLPLREFAAHIVLGLGRMEFANKHWQESEDYYARVLEKYPDTSAVAEALYWASVSCYKQTNDFRVLAEMSQFNPKWKDTIWAIKASVWNRSR